jgi:hypothetical protein
MALAHRLFTETFDKDPSLEEVVDENHFAIAMLSLGDSIRQANP